MKRLNARVEGVVQGVFYRASTRDEAVRIGLTGWVRNVSDGSVEAEIQGEERDVDRMVGWLRTGPRLAQVSRVLTTEKDTVAEEEIFEIRYY